VTPSGGGPFFSTTTVQGGACSTLFLNRTRLSSRPWANWISRPTPFNPGDGSGIIWRGAIEEKKNFALMVDGVPGGMRGAYANTVLFTRKTRFFYIGPAEKTGGLQYVWWSAWTGSVTREGAAAVCSWRGHRCAGPAGPSMPVSGWLDLHLKRLL